jgi:hypothetical protein
MCTQTDRAIRLGVDYAENYDIFFSYIYPQPNISFTLRAGIILISYEKLKTKMTVKILSIRNAGW